MSNCCWLAVCIVVVILCVFVVLCVHCCVSFFTAGLLARSQYSEGPATGHLDTDFSWFPCSSSFPHPGRIAYCPAPDRRPPTTKASHTIRGTNTSIVSSSWWWAYKCRKHVEQIISAINHSVACSWFSSLWVNEYLHFYQKENMNIQMKWQN